MPSIEPESALTAVVAGILHNPQGRILVAQRPLHKHQGGKWEFPGGKIHPGEGVTAALSRELHEELGIIVNGAQPFLRVRHAYPDKTVLLDIWRITDYTGEPQGREGQPLRWVSQDELAALDLPDADVPVLRALKLPALYLISDASRLGKNEFLDRMERALSVGARMIQVREPEMPAAEYRAFAKAVVSIAHRYGAKVILNADPECVASCGADGVHLNRQRLMKLQKRPLHESLLVGASCHEPAELKQAARIGADFSLLSPVRATASHPDRPGLGWIEFTRLRMFSDIPVYALGGMHAEDLPDACAAGATGRAMIRGVWDSIPVEDAVKAMLI